MARGKTKKDKYEDLDEEFKAKVHAADEEGVRKVISEVALHHHALMEAKEMDTDLKEASERASQAGEIYRDGTKAFKLKVSFCRDELTGRGKSVPTA